MEFAARAGGTDRADVAARRPPTRRMAGLLVASTVLHAGLFILAFSSASGDLVSAGGASGGHIGPVFAVTLVRVSVPESQPSENAEDLQPLFAKLRTDTVDAAPLHASEKRSELSSLADRLRPPEKRVPPANRRLNRTVTDLQGSPDPSSQPLSQSLSQLADAREQDGQTASDSSAGDLWARIEPCWRNLPMKTRVTVTVKVVLDQWGQLSRPPEVARAGNTNIDDTRLRAEERALAALRACMPRSDARFGRRSYELVFRSPH